MKKSELKELVREVLNTITESNPNEYGLEDNPENKKIARELDKLFKNLERSCVKQIKSFNTSVNKLKIDKLTHLEDEDATQYINERVSEVFDIVMGQLDI